MNMWNRDVPNQCKTTIYEVYFKVTVTYNAKTWTLTRRNESKIQGMVMKY
jgi:hypothetical protein